LEKKVVIEIKALNEFDTKRFADESWINFKCRDTVLLYGELGSGKTYLTKLYCRMLGVDFDVTSPSFSIINQYYGNVLINHIDFYRVQNRNELINLGLDDIFNMNSINFIEWPQIIEKQITWDHYRIYIEFVDENPSARYIKLISMRN
jgi:tRNA threonylcarbamoyladenosine biosynthesis protein TsaE